MSSPHRAPNHLPHRPYSPANSQMLGVHSIIFITSGTKKHQGLNSSKMRPKQQSYNTMRMKRFDWPPRGQSRDTRACLKPSDFQSKSVQIRRKKRENLRKRCNFLMFGRQNLVLNSVAVRIEHPGIHSYSCVHTIHGYSCVYTHSSTAAVPVPRY